MKEENITKSKRIENATFTRFSREKRRITTWRALAPFSRISTEWLSEFRSVLNVATEYITYHFILFEIMVLRVARVYLSSCLLLNIHVSNLFNVYLSKIQNEGTNVRRAQTRENQVAQSVFIIQARSLRHRRQRLQNHFLHTV
jgi:hypothetical protein